MWELLLTSLQVELLQCQAFGVQGLFRGDHGAMQWTGFMVWIATTTNKNGGNMKGIQWCDYKWGYNQQCSKVKSDPERVASRTEQKECVQGMKWTSNCDHPRYFRILLRSPHFCRSKYQHQRSAPSAFGDRGAVRTLDPSLWVCLKIGYTVYPPNRYFKKTMIIQWM